MTPFLHLKKLNAPDEPIAKLQLTSDTAGQPIYPPLGAIVEHEGVAYSVDIIFWNLQTMTIDVCAEEMKDQ